MAWPSETRVRLPFVAGRFYPDEALSCQIQAKSFVRLDQATLDVSHPWIGGLVPHAGWICSGAIAGLTLATLAAVRKCDVVVVFGAIHTPLNSDIAVLDENDVWNVPTGDTELAVAVQKKIIEKNGPFAMDERFHRNEHAIEVELPLIDVAFPAVKLLPIEVPPNALAAEIGRTVARELQKEKLSPVFLGSTDLTHYGPSYRFTPAGIGEKAIEWAMSNDRRMLSLVQAMKPEAIVPEARSRMNACGAGAIAATMAACREYGADNVRVLKHTNSYQVLRDVEPQRPIDAVGYAAVVIG